MFRLKKKPGNILPKSNYCLLRDRHAKKNIAAVVKANAYSINRIGDNAILRMALNDFAGPELVSSCLPPGAGAGNPIMLCRWSDIPPAVRLKMASTEIGVLIGPDDVVGSRHCAVD